MENNELYHHGIMGMKWGVRRYQNPDGTLTDKGKARFAKVNNSGLKRFRDNLYAKRFLRYNSNRTRNYAKYFDKKTQKAYKKVDKYVTKSEKAQAKGNQKKFKKYQGKAWAELYKSSNYAKRAREYTLISEISKIKLKNIKSGKLKAGKDFIVQRDYDFYVIPPVGVVGMKRNTIIQSPKINDKDYKYVEKRIKQLYENDKKKRPVLLDV